MRRNQNSPYSHMSPYPGAASRLADANGNEPLISSRMDTSRHNTLLVSPTPPPPNTTNNVINGAYTSGRSHNSVFTPPGQAHRQQIVSNLNQTMITTNMNNNDSRNSSSSIPQAYPVAQDGDIPLQNLNTGRRL